jgi:hypothetical protein
MVKSVTDDGENDGEEKIKGDCLKESKETAHSNLSANERRSEMQGWFWECF